MRHDAEIDGKGKRYGRRQPPTRARGSMRRRSRRRSEEKRKRNGRGRAAQPPERSARGEAKRRGGAAAHKRREKRGKREKKRERRAAQPPVSKRSRKQRFLFFCWGLFSWGGFFFFSRLAPSLPLCVAILSRQFPSSLSSGGRAFMSAKILFRRPFGDPSAILRRNPCNRLIPNHLQF